MREVENSSNGPKAGEKPAFSFYFRG